MKTFFVSLSFAVLFSVVSNCEAKITDWQKYLAKGYHELAVGNTENAIVIFSHDVKSHSDSAACHTALGRAFKRKGRMDDAKAEFRVATNLEPTYPDGFYELGVIQEFDKNWADAASAFERYLILKPDASERQALEDRIVFCKSHIKN